MGNARLRNLLFMMTLHAVTCNPVIREYFAKKCGEGKTKMTSLGHCMKKRLLLIRAVWRSGVPYDPAYHRAAG